MLSSSGKHADVFVQFSMIPLVRVVPLTRHFYPPLTRAPSPRGYGLRLVQHELFYLLVFKFLGLTGIIRPSGIFFGEEGFHGNSRHRQTRPDHQSLITDP